MNISGNQFTRKSFNKVSGTWTTYIAASSNAANKRAFTKGTNAWEGANTSADAYGVDDMFGGPNSTYGVGEYGGFAHFKLRTTYTIAR